MTTSTTTTEWFHHFYNPTTPPTTTTTPPSDSTVVSTVPTPSTDVSSRPGPGVSTGRVTRPARRRPRASRKNPTTLLNTDTTNFRAMVQRYTGGVASYAPETTATFDNGFHQGQMSNFNPLLDLQASQQVQLHQQLFMQQHGFGFGSTAAQQGAELDRLYPNSASSSSSMGGGENKRDGFMF